MNIAYIYSTMAKAGGTERMITEKANYLTEHLGYNVTVVTCFQLESEINFFPISEKVKQINLAIPYFSQYKYNYPKRLLVKWQMNRLLKKRISNAAHEINPDILIGVSRFKANYISSIKCKAIKIIECHESRYNTIHDGGRQCSLLVRLYLSIYEYLYFKLVEHHADAVVTLTEGDKKLWKRAKRVEVIPNFSNIKVSKYSDCLYKHVIAIGRLTWEKGFSRLIESWAFVSSKHPDWVLDIYGEGDMLSTLQTICKLYKAKNVVFHHFTSDISLEYSRSSICAVMSYFEGFSLVLLEAMKHGVPCVAFDCPFGPKSIINDGYDGFLVENGDTKLFAERLCRLIEDKELRKQFSKAAIEKAGTYDVNIIMSKWKLLFEELVKKES